MNAPTLTPALVSTDAERATLGCLLNDPASRSRMAHGLRASSFLDRRHGLIFEAACELLDRGEPLDEVTLAEALRRRGQLEEAGGASLLAELTDSVPTTSNAEWYSRAVVEAAVRRRLVHGAQDLGTDLALTLGAAQATLNRVTTPRPGEAQPDPLPAFPSEALPPAVLGIARAFARGVESPLELAVIPLLAVASAALGPRWRVAATRGWVRAPFCWFALCAPSGSGKGPSARPVLEPMVTLDTQMREEHEQALTTWKSECAATKRGEQPDRPVRRRVLVTDTTIEALLTVLAGSDGHGLLLHSDELRTLLDGLDGYRARGAQGRGAWLTMWDGAPVRVVRKVAEGAEADRPFLAVLGGVQPSVLPQLELRNEDGLCPRFLWAHVACGERGVGHGAPQEVQDLWRRMIRAATEHRAHDPMPWTPEGVALLDARHREWTRQANELDEAGMGLQAGFYGKAGEHLVRLVALLHGLDQLAETFGDPFDPGALRAPPVPVATVERGLALLDFFLTHGMHTARLVGGRHQEERAAQAASRDAALVDALRRAVPAAETWRGTAGELQERLGATGLQVGAESLGLALVRLEAEPPPGLRVRRLPRRGSGRPWEIAHGVPA